MKSGIYKRGGKLFRYDFDRAIVERVVKATQDMIDDEIEWEQKHGSQLWGIDPDGYVVINSAGLRRENWTRKAVRDEYLDEWIGEIEEEAACLARNYELYG